MQEQFVGAPAVRSDEKTTEKQDAEKNDDGDDDDLDQAHGEVLDILGQTRCTCSLPYVWARKPVHKICTSTYLEKPQRVRDPQPAAHFGRKLLNKREMVTIQPVSQVEKRSEERRVGKECRLRRSPS